MAEHHTKETEGAPSVATYAGAGLQFAAAIIVFLFLGQWLDRRLGTDPWLMMGGVFLGASAGFYSMYRRLVGTQRGVGADDDVARRPRK
ncbi:MAG: AtpZ/AtpI family protein [Gemmatimonadaceae bacterium]